MELKGKKILVVGLGKTGVGSAKFLALKGAVVFVTDAKAITLPADLLQMGIQQIPHDRILVSEFDLIVPSPGVPPSNSILRDATSAKIEIMSELELAYRFVKSPITPIIAITGTNGKTTTTNLIAKILEMGGKKVFVGGNIGNPFIEYVSSKQDVDIIVLEVSSFQLLYVSTFRPAVALMLNITRDHTDYHGSFEEYVFAKGKIFANQNNDDVAIINAEEAYSVGVGEKTHAQKLYFSSRKQVSDGMFFNEKEIIRVNNKTIVDCYKIENIKIPGRHNIENIMASILATESCGIAHETIERVIENFHGIAHRIEFVANHNGVSFFDDSKGTNVDATFRALESFNKPIVLLMGGKDKDSDFGALKDIIKRKVRKLILFGEARNVIEKAIGKSVDIASVDNMKVATQMACREAKNEEVVLLSPGCASFDEFSSYKERGEVFQRIVKEEIGVR
ncbi:MAG: UDP-N-acetylmuramoyl-L-alanine--D-glutamate ligase [Deltaproteobacteria bacterium]